MKKIPFTALFARLSVILTSIFGKWSSPPWMGKVCQTVKASPKKFGGITAVVLVLVGATAYGISWYKNLPEPNYVMAAITEPEITPNEETLVPSRILVDFITKHHGGSQSVAPLSMINKVVTDGIEISPKIPGEWYWNSDSQLSFTPTEDWPANQKYTITFAPTVFTANTKMSSYEFSFNTKPFTATIKEFKFYQDPVNAETRSAVATLEFNYPVDSASLEKETSLAFQALKQGNLDLKADPIKFTYTYDDHKRVAYLHSETIKINEVARHVVLNLDKKINSSTGSGHLQADVSQNLFIPDSSNFLKVANAVASIVRNDKDRPEQVLTVETTLGVNESDFNKSVHFYLLPSDYPATSLETAKPNYPWSNPGEVTKSILALASPLTKQAIPTEHNYASLHSFKFATQSPRYIYVKIDKGMKGFGGFTLANDYDAVIPVPELPKEISFLHKGSLLALSGEKKLSVLVRGLPAVKFDFARVLPGNLNQLVTQTQGDFNNPFFLYPSFNEQNISQISTEIQPFDATDLSKQQYTALDLSKYLSSDANTSGPQGLFLLKATGWDVTNKTSLGVDASRLILITDLGMLVKDNNDGSHDVFVQSITQGIPVANATVTVLGKNGLPILTRNTDDQGRANFPTLKDFVAEREPVAYTASINNDVSFIPYNNDNRRLNLSKFDVGGIYTNNQELQSLSAYLFSDRGIYRPGDTVHIGMIVKQAYAQAQPAGLPLQATVTDSRGTTIKDQQFTLDESGYMDLDFTTTSTSPTGQYSVNLYLVKDNLPQNYLGSTSLRVAEFLPDRMRITTSLEPKPADGWSSPVGLKAEVGLWNLYGAPATDRKISGRILLIPQKIEFDTFPDYVFADPLADPKKPAKVFSDTLTDLKTNDKGQVEFDLNLERFEKATYQMTFFAEGFEADGGRSVTSQTKALISPLPYFVGYKPDGDLTFIKQNSERHIHFIAVNPQLTREEIKDLRLQLVSMHPVTTLVKKEDGTYQYQSIIQSSIISTTPFSIADQGSIYTLPSDNIGDFSLQVLGKDDTVLSQLNFSIVGASQQPLAKNAELSIKLNKEQYVAGEDIEIQITAPYTGSGLITIERDKVYATQWFKTDTTSSVQTIHVPADFQGNGYVNVAFIRDWESPELFISPLSYSVAPFTVNHDNHDIKIDLQAAAVVKPGEPLTIDYHSDKPGKIIVFAVDEGILQVGQYETPDPLDFFFQKHALEVFTQQTVDQILPKFIQDRELSAAGGDGSEEDLASRLNPFKRKTDLPVVYWSGIIDTDSTNRQLTYNVPDYFNGSIKIMAVAVSTDSIGATDAKTEVRGDYIINPNVPTFVAPGDAFEISASVANNVKDSGEHAKVAVELTASPELEIIGSNKQALEIAEGREKTVHYRIRAKSLGSAKVSFQASSGDKSSAMNATLSVRPVNPFTTYIDSGSAEKATKTIDVIQTLYPEYRTVEATMSTSPLILVFGLQRYLDNFPYGCTEQLTSKALPLLAMNKQAGYANDSANIAEKVNATIQMLSQRQMSNGGFSYWPGLGDNQGNLYASIYAMHFLTEAKAQGFNVPGNMFYNGISFLKDTASQNATDMETARLYAYATYVLTRNEIVTTNYLTNLQLYLQKAHAKEWQNDIAGVYIAASYQMLKSFKEAEQLISQYKPKSNNEYTTDFYDNNIADAQYLYIIAKHFPDRLKKSGSSLVLQLVAALNNNDINTVLSGYASLALGAYEQDNALVTLTDFSMTKTLLDNKTIQVPADNMNYLKAVLGTDVKQITLNNPGKQTYFYQFAQAGFDKALPKQAIKEGIELVREYQDDKGNVIKETTLGSEIEVHIQIRALDNVYISNIAIEDLLPGGFEVVRDSVKLDAMDYFDVREDRVNFFGNVDSTAKQIVYKIKAINTGKFSVPPPYAESMYDAKTKARGVAGEITVTDAK